jgi:hypothetical protein
VDTLLNFKFASWLCLVRGFVNVSRHVLSYSCYSLAVRRISAACANCLPARQIGAPSANWRSLQSQ